MARGQALVEAALALLLLFTLLGCASRAAVAALLRGKAESAAFQAALRHGRGQAPVDETVRTEAFGPCADLSFSRNTNRISPPAIPLPLSLAGRSRATARAEADDGVRGTALSVPNRPCGAASAELSCDPWHGGTRSGRAMRGTVRAFVLAGWAQ